MYGPANTRKTHRYTERETHTHTRRPCMVKARVKTQRERERHTHVSWATLASPPTSSQLWEERGLSYLLLLYRAKNTSDRVVS